MQEARMAASKARAEPSSSLPILDSGVRNLGLKVNTSYEGGGAQMWFSNESHTIKIGKLGLAVYRLGSFQKNKNKQTRKIENPAG